MFLTQAKWTGASSYLYLTHGNTVTIAVVPRILDILISLEPRFHILIRMHFSCFLNEVC